MEYFVGIDWAQEEHAVCVLDGRGKVEARFVAKHTDAGLSGLCARLGAVAEPKTLRIAVERPSGLLVATLVDAGFIVVPIHPNVVKASRPRYTAAGGKDDRRDAYILADLLRTDGHRFRELRGSSDALRALQALVRTRDDLVATRVGLANQLRSLLETYWTGAAALFANLDSRIALAFLERFPTPESARRLGPKRLERFLAQYEYSGRRTAAELLERLEAAAKGVAGPRESEAKGVAVRALVAALRPLVAQITELTSLIEHQLDDHPDGPIIASFPRAGKINAAQILAELGDDRGRFTSEEHLAAEAGVSPVTHASGKRSGAKAGISFRRACNHRLRAAVTCFAGNSRHGSSWAAEVYRRARANGHDHPHAVRILARAWVRVLWRCWQAKTPYDAAKHNAAKRFAA